MTTTCNTTFTIRPLLCRVWLATLLLATISQVPEAEAWVVPDPVVHFGIGAVAGGVGAFAAYPFDYIKSQLQTEYGKETWGNDGIQALKDTLKEHGPFHLYKGLTVQLVGVAPEKAIKLGVNDIIASAFMSNYGIFPLWGQVVSGSVAGACQVVASSPLEVLKVGLQTSDRNLATVWTEIGGIRGLFRGCGACMMRDIVFTAICFPFYHYLVQDLSWPSKSCHLDFPSFLRFCCSRPGMFLTVYLILSNHSLEITSVLCWSLVRFRVEFYCHTPRRDQNKNSESTSCKG